MQNPKGWAMTLGAAASFAGLAGGAAELARHLRGGLLRSAWQWRLLNGALALALAASIAPMWL